MNSIATVPHLHDGRFTGIEVLSPDCLELKCEELGGRKWRCILKGNVYFRCVDMRATNIILDVSVKPASSCDRELYEWIRREEGIDPALFNQRPDFLKYVDSEMASSRWVLELTPSIGCAFAGVCDSVQWERVLDLEP